MPLDWHYHRPGCATCKKMQDFLSERNLEATEVVNASKTRYDGAAALELTRTADRLVIAKGRRVVDFDMRTDPPDDETLLKHLLGPTGNLRAPTLRIGNTLVIGFNEPEFSKLFAELGL